MAAEEWAAYDRSGRAIERYRMEIRGAFGFRECSEDDRAELAEWPAVEHAAQCAVPRSDLRARAVASRRRDGRPGATRRTPGEGWELPLPSRTSAPGNSLITKGEGGAEWTRYR